MRIVSLNILLSNVFSPSTEPVNNLIYDFTTNTSYLPNGTTKLLPSNSADVTIHVGAGGKITEDYIQTPVNFDVKVTAVQ